MRLVLFCHSLVSDWNHGNAHFLRGVYTGLRRRGHDVLALEPADGWSRQSLLQDRGPAAPKDPQRKLLKSSLVSTPLPKKKTIGSTASTPMSPTTPSIWLSRHHRAIVPALTAMTYHCVPVTGSFETM